jgi:AAA family ATP:ADP antiporter
MIRAPKHHEWYSLTLSFLYYFCVLTAYYVMRPMRDQLAAEVGSANLPWFFAATLLAMLILTPLFSWLVSRFPRHIFMPVVYLFFVGCQLIFVYLFNNPSLLTPKALGMLFFVWVSIFNLFVVSVFWSFMADIWNDQQARRLFPLIALGGTMGAVTGPLITRSLIEIVSPSALLLISTLLLSLTILCIALLGKRAHPWNAEGKDAALGGGLFDGLKQIFENAFIRTMTLIMLLNDAIGTIAYVLVTDYSSATYMNDSIAQTRFAANMDLASNTLQIILQLTITRWMLARFGAGLIFLTCGAVIFITCLIMALSNDPFAPLLGTMPFVAITLILSRAFSYGMIQPARESLYTLVTRDLRYKGKNAVDTVMWRFGDVTSLLSIKVFQTMGVTIAGFGLIWAGLAAVSGLLGWRLANRAEKGDFSKPRI